MGAGSSHNPDFNAVVPKGARSGDTFSTMVNGKNVLVRVPQGKSPGQMFKFKMSEIVHEPPPGGGGHFTPGSSPGMQKVQVTVPPNVFPNQLFRVNVNGTLVDVKCPMTGIPGQLITVEIPIGPPPSAPASPPLNPNYSPGTLAALPNQPPVQIQVTIPPGIYPGQPFQVSANNQIISVTAPSGSHPGQMITVEIPSLPPQQVYAQPVSPQIAPTLTPYGYNSNTTSTQNGATFGLSNPQAQSAYSPTQTETYKVTIPIDVRPGQTFEAIIGGKKEMITCPMNAHSGMILTLQGPSAPPQSSAPPPQMGYAATALPMATAVSAVPVYQNQQPHQQQVSYGAPPPQYQSTFVNHASQSSGGGAVMNKEY